VPLELGDWIRKPARRSRRGTDLAARLQAVAASLGVTPTLVPATQAEVDRLQTFRLLAHSEIQQSVEDLVSRVLEVTADKGRSGSLTHAGHQLLVYQAMEPLNDKRKRSEARYPSFPTRPAAAAVRLKPEPLLKAVAKHEMRVKDNNGVKQGNLRALLLPLGFREGFFLPGFLPQADALGRARGEVAHGSGLLNVGAVNWPTGQGELTAVAAVRAGITHLDRYAPRLLMPVS
jgi:hypothetical protein